MDDVKLLKSLHGGNVKCYVDSDYTKIRVDYSFYSEDPVSEQYILTISSYEEILKRVIAACNIPFASIIPLEDGYECSFYAKLVQVDLVNNFISYQTYSFIDDANPWEICETDKIYKIDKANAFLIKGEDYSFFIEFESK